MDAQVQIVGETIQYTDGSCEHLAGRRPPHERKKGKLMIRSYEIASQWQYSLEDAAKPIDESREQLADYRPHPHRQQLALTDRNPLDATSDGAHRAGNNSTLQLMLKPRAQVFIEMLTDTKLKSGEEGRERWLTCLRVNPVVEQIQRADGTLSSDQRTLQKRLDYWRMHYS